jgi:hypothetical protein
MEFGGRWGRSICAGIFAAAGLAAASPALAVNLGFETGDTTGWTSSSTSLTGVVTSFGSFSPFEGSYFGFAKGGAKDVATTLSQTFNLVAGQTISGEWGFQARDVYLYQGKIYNDDASIAVNGVQLDYRDVLTVGDNKGSGWLAFSYTALAPGAYTLTLSSTNHGDGSAPSYALLDDVSVSRLVGGGVPEPASWALLALGTALLGAGLRMRRSRSPDLLY